MLAALAGSVATPGVAETMVVRYLCERGMEVPATYVHGDGTDPVAVIDVEGGPVTLVLEPSASGARYGWPSGGSGYVWWTKEGSAALYWRDGETTIEEAVYSDCVRRD